MNKTAIALALSAFAATPALAASFVNGGFEDGTFNGWTEGSGYRASENNAALQASQFLPGGSLNQPGLTHSAIVGAGIAPNTDGNLQQVYSGSYSARAEDTIYGGYASAITQTVANYTDPSIFFAWAAVLQGAHGPSDAATFKLTLTDDTPGNSFTPIVREYNAASGGSGVDARFTLSSNGFYYTAWQVEQLDVSAFQGDTFTLSLLAADCQPTGHAGYVYLDGFGAVNPPSGQVPEPASLALLGLGLAGLAAMRRRKNA